MPYSLRSECPVDAETDDEEVICLLLCLTQSFNCSYPSPKQPWATVDFSMSVLACTNFKLLYQLSSDRTTSRLHQIAPLTSPH